MNLIIFKYFKVSRGVISLFFVAFYFIFFLLQMFKQEKEKRGGGMGLGDQSLFEDIHKLIELRIPYLYSLRLKFSHT